MFGTSRKAFDGWIKPWGAAAVIFTWDARRSHPLIFSASRGSACSQRAAAFGRGSVGDGRARACFPIEP